MKNDAIKSTVGLNPPEIKLIAASRPGALVFSSPSSTPFNRFASICKFLGGRCSISTCKCNLKEGFEAQKAIFFSSWTSTINQINCSRSGAEAPTQPTPGIDSCGSYLSAPIYFVLTVAGSSLAVCPFILIAKPLKKEVTNLPCKQKWDRELFSHLPETDLTHTSESPHCLPWVFWVYMVTLSISAWEDS